MVAEFEGLTSGEELTALLDVDAEMDIGVERGRVAKRLLDSELSVEDELDEDVVDKCFFDGRFFATAGVTTGVATGCAITSDVGGVTTGVRNSALVAAVRSCRCRSSIS